MVKIMRPNSISEAFDIALLQENITTLNKTLKFQTKPTYLPRWSSIPQKPPKMLSKTYLPPILNQAKKTQPLKFKIITPTNIQTKRSLGLCFKCDEKHTLGHICKNKMWNLMLINEEVMEPDREEKYNLEICAKEEVIEISINALSWSLRPKTIRIPGQVKKRRVSILIDSGSTHSFIDEKLIWKLKYKVEATQPVTVIVANGDKLNNNAMCNPLSWTIQGLECWL